MTKTDELLKVLDLPEDEQIQFLVDNLESCTEQSYLPDQLADLAFRLRDEVCHISPIVETNFCKALDRVEAHCNNTDQDNFCWWLLYAQPIHWIIASLIAKEEKP